MKRDFRQRRRGTLASDTEELRRRYDQATAGKRRPPDRADTDPLYLATGDPLVFENRAAASAAYGLSASPRPASKLRRIAAECWGDDLDALTQMSRFYQELGRSALRAAGEAVALGAERGCWIGLRAPVSFEHAVEVVRKSLRRAAAARPSDRNPPGWTGTYLTVRPKEGLSFPVPGKPPGAHLPQEGGIVRDDSYWRRCIADGDVTLCPGSEINAQRSEPRGRIEPSWKASIEVRQGVPGE